MNLRTLILLTIVCILPFANSSAQTVVLSEDFDGPSPPDLPINWVGDTGWKTSTSSASAGSGLNNVSHTGSSPGDLFFPLIDLFQATSGRIRFLARRTSSYDVDALVLLASIDQGTTFPFVVLNAGDALPTETSTYGEIVAELPPSLLGQQSVLFKFSSSGGSSSGSNIRLDDVEVSASLSATTDTSLVSEQDSTLWGGFLLGQTSIVERSVDVTIPIQLSTPDSLRGLQFDLHIPDTILQLNRVSLNPAITAQDTWRLDWHQGLDKTTIVAVNQGPGLLLPGQYADLISLHLSVGALSGTDAEQIDVQLSDFIVSFAKNDTTSGRITLKNASLDVTIRPRTASIELQPDSLVFGTAFVDSSVIRYMRFSNEDGTTPLVLSAFSSQNILFKVDADSLVVAAGNTDSLRVQFRPARTQFGQSTGQIMFEHNVTSNPVSAFNVSGIGIGGRGDSNQDGEVNVGDLLDGIDFAIKARPYSNRSLLSLDQFPRYSGDARIDVQDLGLLIDALLLRRWSDGVALPIPTPNNLETSQFLASKVEPIPLLDAASQQNVQGDSVYVELIRISSTEDRLQLRTDVLIRGLELSLANESFSPVNFRSASRNKDITFSEELTSLNDDDSHQNRSLGPSTRGAQITWMEEPIDGRVEILLTTPHGLELQPGIYELGYIERYGAIDDVIVGRAVAYDESLTRRAVMVTMAPIVNVNNTDSAAPVPISSALEQPFPNPWSRTDSQTLRLRYQRGPDARTVSFALFDVLGREVPTPGAITDESEWRWTDSQQTLTPGLYFIRMETAQAVETRSVFVIE